jgi:3-deoxy-D-manno-octulosonic acid kinase
MKSAEISNNGLHILYDTDLLSGYSDDLFEVEQLRSDGLLDYAVSGRGLTYFFRWSGDQLVLKHYHRGGLFAKWLSDRYVRTGVTRSRPWKEWSLLKKLIELALPVPIPVAVRVQISGLFYRADIITKAILNASPLSTWLSNSMAHSTPWESIGKTIMNFHHAGVYHADLNANNILIDNEQKVYLIDFDKARIRRPQIFWQQKNLRRLQRSLLKLQSQSESFKYSTKAWDELLAGYKS